MQPIAVIGLQIRFPGDAPDPNHFYDQLLAAESFVQPVPSNRWSLKRFATDDYSSGKTPVSKGCFIDYNYDTFDPHMFGFSAQETNLLDPQQRLLLEVTWEALERSYLNPANLAGENIGVYMGGFTTDHLLNQFSATARGALTRYSASGSTLTMLANRLSYSLDLRGPSLTVDTACASSLNALAIACNDLQAKRCPIALVGAVNFMLRPEYTLGMSAAGFLAEDGQSKPFSNLANGYGRGEGCAVLVLKPLDKALADQDNIEAVIESIACGHDGRTAGISLPSMDAQRDIMEQALSQANLTADQIGYVEAHGTGTIRGDQSEAASIGSVYGKSRRNSPLTIGSLKANIGHLEAAAGIAGLVKAIMMLKIGKVPPHVLPGYLNPEIPFNALNLRIADQVEPLDADYVGVNSFGYGGSNAHAILSRPPQKKAVIKEQRPKRDMLLPLSAQSREVLYDFTSRLADHVKTGIQASDLVYSLGKRRTYAQANTALWVNSSLSDKHLSDLLTKTVNDGRNVREQTLSASHKKHAFLFSGMGSQFPGMGQKLWETSPVFQKVLREIDRYFQPLSGFSLIQCMFEDNNANQTWPCRIAQPANFALQVGLVAILEDFGLSPNLCIGHSAGEVAAAYVSGHVSLKDAVYICWVRSDLQDRQAGSGHLLAVRMTLHEAEELCATYHSLSVEIAAHNGERAMTLVIPQKNLEKLELILRNEKRAFRHLVGDIAYHSTAMDTMKEALLERLNKITCLSPRCHLVSSVSAKPIDAKDQSMDAPYWWQNIRKTVLFHDAIQQAMDLDIEVVTEIGPQPVLNALLKPNKLAHTCSILSQQKDTLSDIQNVIKDLYLSGAYIDWDKMAQGGTRVSLPVTGWSRQKFWHEAPVQAMDRLAPEDQDPWAETSLVPARWIADLNRNEFIFLKDHKVDGEVILPGAAALQAAESALNAQHNQQNICLSNIHFKAPLILDRNTCQILDTRLLSDQLEILAYDPARPTVYLKLFTAQLAPLSKTGQDLSILELNAQIPYPLDVEKHYERLSSLGLNYGPAFQVIRNLSINQQGDRLLAHLCLKKEKGINDLVKLGPCLIDGVLQSALAFTVSNAPYVPVSIGSFIKYRALPHRIWAQLSLHRNDENEVSFDAEIYDQNGQHIASFTDIIVKNLKPAPVPLPLPEQMLVTQWENAPLDPHEQSHKPNVHLIADEGAERQQLQHALTEQGVHLGAIENSEITVTLISETQKIDAGFLAHLIQTCHSCTNRIYIITRNALSQNDAARADHSAIHGLCRTLSNEFDHCDITLLDVISNPFPAHSIAREVCSSSPSNEVILTAHQRLIPKLISASLSNKDSAPPDFRKNASYFITGGLGGFGRELCLWLAKNGAGHIIVSSRSTPAHADIAPLKRKLEQLGATLSVLTLDLCDQKAVDQTIKTLAISDTPLAGIFHWAGLTRDCPAHMMSEKDIQLVFDPKVGGGTALDQASQKHCPALDYFVLASSLSAVVGNPLQANYAAANAYLDGLAWQRRCKGLPALSVNFGPISRVGMAANPLVMSHLKAAGLTSISPQVALLGLGAAINEDLVQVSLSGKINSQRWAQYAPRSIKSDKMREILDFDEINVYTPQAPLTGLTNIPLEDHKHYIAENLQTLLSTTMGTAKENIPKNIALARIGLDSMTASEFQILIERDFHITVSITSLLSTQSLNDIAQEIITRIEHIHTNEK